MKQRFPLSTVAPPLSLIASALDPRYKTLDFIPEENRAVVWKRIQEEIPSEAVADLEAETLGTASANIEHPSKKAKRKEDEVKSGLDILFGAANEVSSSGQRPEDELKAYQHDRTISRAEDPLAWWKANETKYPRLAILTRRYLSITATSVPSERVFSVAGLILNKRRSALSAEHANILIFLNKNCQ